MAEVKALKMAAVRVEAEIEAVVTTVEVTSDEMRVGVVKAAEGKAEVTAAEGRVVEMAAAVRAVAEMEEGKV